MAEGEAMSIPRGRDRLLELCDEEYQQFSVEDIQAAIRAIIAEEFYRKVHPASLGERTKYPTPKPEVVLAVRRDKIANNALPRAKQALDIEIGKRYGIEIGGRVSEILYGDEDGNAVFDVAGEKVKFNRRRRKASVRDDFEDLM